MQFDPRAPEFRANPYRYYQMLQAHAPVFYWETWGIWFLSRYEDCNALLRDNRLGHTPTSNWTFPDEQRPLFEMMSNWILQQNPPNHTRLRSFVQKAFTPRMVAHMREGIQQIADNLLDRVQERGSMDLMTDYAYPLPVNVICTMLGVPPEDHIHFHVWSDAIARALDLTDQAEVYERATSATVALNDYLAILIAERRAHPKDDLISALVAVEQEGERLTRAELFATCALLLIAGHETTVNLIGNGTLALLRHPDQWRKLRESPALIPNAVEELLRYDSPVQMTSRIALEDISYKGHLFRAGQEVGFLLGAANHDAAQFENPAMLDVERPNIRHMSFGGGIHYCLGAPLARLEGAIAIRTLGERLPNLALATDSITHRDNYVLRGLESLPVTF